MWALQRPGSWGSVQTLGQALGLTQRLFFCIYYLKERSTNHAYAFHTYTFYQIKLLFIVFV